MYDENDYEDATRQDVLMYTSLPEIKAYKRHPGLWMDIADLAASLSGDKGLGPRERRLFARAAEDLEDVATMLSGQTPEEWDGWCRLEALKEEVMAAKAALENEITAAKVGNKKTIATAKSVLKTLSKSPIKKKAKQASTPSIKKKPKQPTAAIPKAKKSTRRKPSASKRAKKQRR